MCFIWFLSSQVKFLFKYESVLLNKILNNKCYKELQIYGQS